MLDFFPLFSKTYANFYETVAKNELISRNDKILIGLSGGADSVLLTLLMLEYQKINPVELVCLHINHQIRKEESKRDQDFSLKFAQEKNIPFIIRTVDINRYSKEKGISLEMAGREERYRIFEEVSEETHSQKIATAHHLDDRIETSFLKIIEGAGVASLAGLKIKYKKIIRPLFYLTKQDIISTLKEINQNFMDDSTNFQNDYERNYIRNEILPKIQKKFPAYKERMKVFLDRIHQEEQVWEELYQILDQKVVYKNNFIMIDKSLLMTHSFALIRRWLISRLYQKINLTKKIPESIFDTILNHQSSIEGNKIIFQNKDFRILSSYNQFIFEKQNKNFEFETKYVKINQDKIRIQYNSFDMSLEKSGKIEKSPFSCKFKVVDSIQFRKRNEGDRIVLENGKTKKIKDILIDSKINLIDRECLFVMGTNDSIIGYYIPNKGFRISKPFHVINEEVFCTLTIN